MKGTEDLHMITRVGLIKLTIPTPVLELYKTQ